MKLPHLTVAFALVLSLASCNGPGYMSLQEGGGIVGGPLLECEIVVRPEASDPVVAEISFGFFPPFQQPAHFKFRSFEYLVFAPAKDLFVRYYKVDEGGSFLIDSNGNREEGELSVRDRDLFYWFDDRYDLGIPPGRNQDFTLTRRSNDDKEILVTTRNPGVPYAVEVKDRRRGASTKHEMVITIDENSFSLYYD